MERRRGSEWGVQVWEYLKSRNGRKKHLKQVWPDSHSGKGFQIYLLRMHFKNIQHKSIQHT